MPDPIATIVVWAWLQCSPADCGCLVVHAPPEFNEPWPANWNDADRIEARAQYGEAVARCASINKRCANCEGWMFQ